MLVGRHHDGPGGGVAHGCVGVPVLGPAFGFEHLGTRRDTKAGRAQRAVVAPGRHRSGVPVLVDRKAQPSE